MFESVHVLFKICLNIYTRDFKQEIVNSDTKLFKKRFTRGVLNEIVVKHLLLNRKKNKKQKR